MFRLNLISDLQDLRRFNVSAFFRILPFVSFQGSYVGSTITIMIKQQHVKHLTGFLFVSARYDDYNYGEVNQLLERPLKVFIKTVSCFPEKTTRNIYDAFWKQFRHSEKVHVNIMLMEARVQVELMYGMRAISEYLRDN